MRPSKIKRLGGLIPFNLIDFSVRHYRYKLVTSKSLGQSLLHMR